MFLPVIDQMPRYVMVEKAPALSIREQADLIKYKILQVFVKGEFPCQINLYYAQERPFAALVVKVACLRLAGMGWQTKITGKPGDPLYYMEIF